MDKNSELSNNKKIIAKWSDLGLLEAFDWQDLSLEDINTKKMKCAILFENATSELTTVDSVMIDRIIPLVYPIICRTLLKLPVNTNITTQNIIEEINKCGELLNDLEKYEVFGLDIEGIFVTSMEEIITNKYKTIK